MFIESRATPNPATMKFLPGREVMASGTANFVSAEEAERSPLAQRLLALDGVTGVFLGPDFITVTKGEREWQQVKPAVLGAVTEHFDAGLPVITGQAERAQAAGEVDDVVVARIKELLDVHVRPAVAQDGGDVVFHGFEEGVVSLYMQGACSGCPSATVTLKYGIENLLRHYIPAVKEVRAV